MIVDAKRKYKAYPNLVKQMKTSYLESEYEKSGSISYFLKDYYEFFINYLIKIFPFRKKSLKILDMQTPSPLDYIVELTYNFKQDEIKIINEILNSKNWEKKPESIQICNYLILYCAQSFAVPIKEIFERPFSFFPLNVEKKFLEDETILIKIRIQGREQ